MQSFDVTGMSCGHCVGAVTAAVQAADPGAVVQVDLAQGRVSVTGGTAGAERIVAAIQAEGYDATPARG